MGGPGSTRWGRRRTEPRVRICEALRLDTWQAVRALKAGRDTRLGAIEWSRRPLRSKSGYLVRKGSLMSNGVVFRAPCLLRPRHRYTVFLVAWPLAFDRFHLTRWWLVCTGCAKRRKTLFLWHRSKLRCRVCLGLVYESQCLTAPKRAAAHRLKIARRIIDCWDASDYPPDRPWGAHRKRYARLLEAWTSENGPRRGSISRS